MVRILMGMGNPCPFFFGTSLSKSRVMDLLVITSYNPIYRMYNPIEITSYN